jgi:hypothetical protein
MTIVAWTRFAEDAGVGRGPLLVPSPVCYVKKRLECQDRVLTTRDWRIECYYVLTFQELKSHVRHESCSHSQMHR